MTESGLQTNLEYGELNISGDETAGFRPFQLMVSSIAGCSAGVLKKVLQKMRLSFNDMRITATVKRNLDKANRIEEIHLHFFIYADDLKPEKVAKALALSRKNCAMIQSVQDSITVTEDFDIILSKK